jgi:hypothetical protein
LLDSVCDDVLTRPSARAPPATVAPLDEPIPANDNDLIERVVA